MWDLETIKHMNTPEEIKKSQALARGVNGVDASSDADVGSNPATSTKKLYTPDELVALGATDTYPYTVKEFLERRKRRADIKIGCIKQSLGENDLQT
jgi:hypothetical protein